MPDLGLTLAALRATVDLCEEARASLDLNVTEELALSALGFRLGATGGIGDVGSSPHRVRG